MGFLTSLLNQCKMMWLVMSHLAFEPASILEVKATHEFACVATVVARLLGACGPSPDCLDQASSHLFYFHFLREVSAVLFTVLAPMSPPHCVMQC